MTQNYKNEQSKKPAEIETEIGQTRSAINQDIKALGDKFSPEHLKQEAKGAVIDVKDAALGKITDVAEVAAEKLVDAKNATVDKLVEVKDVAVDKLVEAKDVATEKLTLAKDATVAAVTETVDDVSYQARKIGSATWSFARANAVPLTLIGIGVGWVISSQREGDRWRVKKPAMRPRPADRVTAARDNTVGEPRRLNADATFPERNGARKPDDVGSRAATELGEASAKLGESAARVYDRAQDTLVDTQHKVASSMVRGRDAVKSTLKRAGTASLTYADENPFALGVVTVAAGLGLGLLLPSTEQENRWLGASRDRILGEARATAKGLSDVVKETVEETSNAVG